MIDLPKFEVKEGQNTPAVPKNNNIPIENTITDLPVLISIQTPIPPDEKKETVIPEIKKPQEEKKLIPKPTEKKPLSSSTSSGPPVIVKDKNESSLAPQGKPELQESSVPQSKPEIKTPSDNPDPDLMKKRVDRFKYVPDFDNMSYEDQVRARVTYEINLAKIAERYPQFNIKIPERTESLRQIHIRYMEYLRKTTIDSGVFQWRQYLILTWALMELLCTKVLGLNASGFTMHQLMRMNHYDDLLSELGEKYNGSITSGWPIEGKIAFYTCLHIVVFVVTNYICKYFGDNAGNAVRNMIDNFSTGKVVYPTNDGKGNISVPAAVSPNSEAGNIYGIPVAPAAQLASNLPIGNLNLLGNLFGGGNNNQNQNNNNNQNNNQNNNPNNNPNNNNNNSDNNNNNNSKKARRPIFTE
jgi:hypothetical protein